MHVTEGGIISHSIQPDLFSANPFLTPGVHHKEQRPNEIHNNKQQKQESLSLEMHQKEK